MEYSINCEVEGSVPDTDIRWMQNNRPFSRGKVSLWCQMKKKTKTNLPKNDVKKRWDSIEFSLSREESYNR